ncbi:MAG: ade [Phycisphaerales bacterium]|nr:ade [Phycisphaerales bacterium]
MIERSRLLSVARGDTPADLVLRHARTLNVFTGEIESGDIAIVDGLIAGIGDGYQGKEVVDLGGAYVAPGLIDAHVHIESSLCTPPQFATAVVPRGVTTVVTDPHEIANVAGVAGVQYMIDASRDLPLSVKVMAPSCVPATPLGTAGAGLSAADLGAMVDRVHGLAEVMNFPGVIFGDAEVLAKIDAYRDCPIDGHCPGVTGKALNAYVAAGVGSDHESITLAEAKEKLSRGLYLLIREATNARNLHALLPLITPHTNRRICFCTDDRVPADLLSTGGIDHMVREAIAFGIEPVEAFRLATLNTAEWFGLSDRGAIAPGRRADLMIFDDLRAPMAKAVYAAGKLVAELGSMARGAVTAAAPPLNAVPEAVRGRVAITLDDRTFRIAAESVKVRVIGSIEGQLVTEPRVATMPVRDGALQSDVAADILKMGVLERHGRTGNGGAGAGAIGIGGKGNVGLGFISGFGLKRGAIAGTVAHDHHNLVVIGVDDAAMVLAARRVAELGGGLCVVDGDRVVAELALPVAGLMSDQPIETVRAGYDGLLKAAAALGATAADPFMAMSFMALEVIPSLKLTDRGLVDVTKFEIVSLYV